jgi:GNAT superfamily N-acetyltransferase
MPAQPAARARVLTLCKASGALIAAGKEGDAVLAFAAGIMDTSTNVLTLEELCVARERRGEGIGVELLEFVLRQAATRRAERVRASHRLARENTEFLISRGFVLTGEHGLARQL